MSSVARSSDVGFELYAPALSVGGWKVCGIHVEFRNTYETITALVKDSSLILRCFRIQNTKNSSFRMVKYITIEAGSASSIALFAQVVRHERTSQDLQCSMTNYFPMSFVGASSFEPGKHYRITIRSNNEESGLVAEFAQRVFTGCHSSDTKVC